MPDSSLPILLHINTPPARAVRNALSPYVRGNVQTLSLYLQIKTAKVLTENPTRDQVLELLVSVEEALSMLGGNGADPHYFVRWRYLRDMLQHALSNLEVSSNDT